VGAAAGHGAVGKVHLAGSGQRVAGEVIQYFTEQAEN
jgi:hypothetical protein